MPTYYTTQNEMEEILGEEGIALRMDDVDSAAYTTTLDRIRADATEMVNMYLLTRYDAEDLNLSTWVRRRTTFIACYLLSKRRGNAALFMMDYEESMAQLEAIKDGILLLPGIPTTADLMPTMSNFVMDSRHTHAPMRVRSELSVGATYGEQFISYSIPFLWI